MIHYNDMAARNRALDAHKTYLAAGRESGTVVESGPFADGRGGMYVLEVPDERAAHAFVAADPYKTQARLDMKIRRWQSVRGKSL